MKNNFTWKQKQIKQKNEKQISIVMTLTAIIMWVVIIYKLAPYIYGII